MVKRILDRLSKIEQQTGETGLKEFNAFTGNLFDVANAVLNEHIADRTVLDRIKNMMYALLPHDTEQPQHKPYDIGLNFYCASRQEIAIVADCLTDIVVEASKEYIADTTVVERIRQDLARRLYAVVDATRPSDAAKKLEQRAIL